MITVETFTDLKLYNRVTEVKNKVEEYLLLEATLKAGNKKLNTDTIKYTTEIVKGSKGCGCTDRLKVILTVEVI